MVSSIPDWYLCSQDTHQTPICMHTKRHAYTEQIGPDFNNSKVSSHPHWALSLWVIPPGTHTPILVHWKAITHTHTTHAYMPEWKGGGAIEPKTIPIGEDLVPGLTLIDYCDGPGCSALSKGFLDHTVTPLRMWWVYLLFSSLCYMLYGHFSETTSGTFHFVIAVIYRGSQKS